MCVYTYLFGACVLGCRTWGPGGGWGEGGGREAVGKLEWGHTQILDEAPTDDPKTKRTLQKPNILNEAPAKMTKQSPKSVYKAPKD